jgi:hypothetical protein
MKAAIRVTLACFSMYGLQNWLHAISAVFLLFAVIAGLTADSGKPSMAGGLATAAAALVLLIPAYGGGNALRYLLSRNATLLWPRGRERILAGATLAITLMACIATVPTLIGHLAELSGAHDPFAKTIPTTVFAAAWACITAMWIFSYVVSASPRTYFLIFLIPIATSRFSRTITPLLPAASTGLAVAMVCWSAFVIWVLRTGAIRMPNLMRGNDPMGLGNNAGAIKYDLFPYEPASRATAIRQYLLGAPTWWGSVLVGAGMLLMVAMLVGLLLSHGETRDAKDLPLTFLGIFMASSPSIAFMLVRRARLLWLRAGANREELFRITERHGLLSTMISLGVFATGLVAWSLVLRPDLFSSILLSALSSLVFSVALFYAFFSFTRGLNALDVLLGIVSGIALIVHTIIVRPTEHSIRSALTLLVIWAALAPLLRWQAARRWRNLDWRVAMPMVMPAIRSR